MKITQMENLHRSIFFGLFDSDYAFPQKATINELVVLRISIFVGNWLIHGP